MLAAIKAGLAYFAVVFATGFVLGTLRVLVLVPRAGELLAVSLELPLILSVSWFAARWLIGRFAVPANLPVRLVMGGLAFILLIAAEVALSTFVFGRTHRELSAGFGTPPGLVGLLGQIAFAAIPAMRLMFERR